MSRMRTILFRGKDLYTGNWTYGYYVHRKKRTGCFGQTVTDMDRDRSYIISSRENFEVITETLGQFTGITDKNEKKIFEGDILNMYGSRLMEVFWNEESLAWEVRDVGTKDYEVNHLTNSFSLGKILVEAAYGEVRTEIVGNIFDIQADLQR